MSEDDLKLSALQVSQWLDSWDEGVEFTENESRERPNPNFYLFSMEAEDLRKLSFVHRRKDRPDTPREEESGIQRQHEPSRSEEINEFIKAGFPWSDLSQTKRESGDYDDLKMPGWLPTAIVANIRTPGAQVDDQELSNENAIEIDELNDDFAEIILPENFKSDDWDADLSPIEIIDGQHRLWAIDLEEDLEGDFELPVVAFYDLDVTWRAYLFYMINIKPKKIDRSLAFDLYPILRIQDWLERSPAGPKIYRETRAQELTEALWSYHESPWYNRIDMLGNKKGPVSQASFVRGLIRSFVKRWDARGRHVGGLFGAELEEGEPDILSWKRPQQAAFLIKAWQSMHAAVEDCDEDWAEVLREHEPSKQEEIPLEEPEGDGEPIKLDKAFRSENCLLATDQGVRGFHNIINDMCYLIAKEKNLQKWRWDDEPREGSIQEHDIDTALNELNEESYLDGLRDYLTKICEELTSFEWRTSSAPGLDEDQEEKQMIYRGSGGYKQIRMKLLEELIDSKDAEISGNAEEIYQDLGYDEE